MAETPITPENDPQVRTTRYEPGKGKTRSLADNDDIKVFLEPSEVERLCELLDTAPDRQPGDKRLYRILVGTLNNRSNLRGGLSNG